MDKNSRDYIVLAENAYGGGGDASYFSSVVTDIQARDAQAAIRKVRRLYPEYTNETLAAVPLRSFHIG